MWRGMLRWGRILLRGLNRGSAVDIGSWPYYSFSLLYIMALSTQKSIYDSLLSSIRGFWTTAMDGVGLERNQNHSHHLEHSVVELDFW
jgi:hypothetical protein